MTTEGRLEKLERDLARARRQVKALFVLGLGLLAIGLLTAAAGNPQEIRARSIVLVDEKGITRAQLYPEKDASILRLRREDGKLGTTLFVNNGGMALHMWDGNGKLRSTLSVVKDGPRLQLFHENGKLGVHLYTYAKTGPGLHMWDANGKVIPLASPNAPIEPAGGPGGDAGGDASEPR